MDFEVEFWIHIHSQEQLVLAPVNLCMPIKIDMHVEYFISAGQCLYEARVHHH